MAGVKGIGGAFIYSEDAARLAAWYREKLGIEFEAIPGEGTYFKVFFTRDPETSALRENPVFAIYQSKGPLPADGLGFMLNLRVDDLDGFLPVLRQRGVEVEERVQVWERGKHAWIRDGDGNRVELYEELNRPGPDKNP